MKLPVVVIFDVDGTLLGDVEPLLTFWHCMKDILHFDDVQARIKSCMMRGFIRPGLRELMNALTKKYQHVEFFIYSSGREEWLDIVIPCIEDILGVSFNRPFFGRSSCIIGYKMIDLIALNILRVIKSKYRGNYSQDGIRNMTVIFDDNPQVFDDMHDFVRIIKCPTFKSRIHIDVVEELGEELCKSHFEHLSRSVLSSRPSATYDEFIAQYTIYKEMLRLCVDIRDESDFFGQFDLDHIDNILFPG